MRHDRVGPDRRADRPLTDAIRPARSTDAQDLFGLLALCFADYPGCFVDPHDDLKDLREPASAFAATRGALWVVDDEAGRVCACVALDYPRSGTAELHRLYVRPDRRGRGLGERLVAFVEDKARREGVAEFVFWSDTRFVRAHALYARLGFRRTGTTRALGDISGSIELGFRKPLA